MTTTFRKLPITGLNKMKGVCKILAAVLAAILLCSIPLAASADEAPQATVTPEQFVDLNPKKYYYADLCEVINAGLFKGVDDTHFQPEASITRAQFLQAMANLCGVDLSAYTEHPFKDVKAGKWYEGCISWGYGLGIVNGISADQFAPDEPITREAMCKMIVYTVEKFFQTPLEADAEVTFVDQASISAWALESVQKAVKAGLFQGDDKGNFNPKENAQRVHAALVILRQYKNNQQTTPSTEVSLQVEGFSLEFDPQTDYYLCTAEDFSGCKIISYSGFKTFELSVEQYNSYYPYQNTAYVLGQPLKLGQGRAKVTINVTLPDNTRKSYLIAITDPNAAGYSYAWTRTSGGTVNLRAAASMNGAILKKINNNTRVYYLGTEGDWCKVQLLYYDTVGYIHKDYLQVAWDVVEMPERYKTAVEALQAAHPNWTFDFVDVEMTYAAALGKYGSDKAQYIDPLNYLAEDKIFALLDIDTYDTTLWNDNAVAAIWANETYISKTDAVSYFKRASESILMNPVYIACRAALESGYGGSKFARGMVPNYEGYYNFFGIQCVDANPEKGAAYARDRNWNTVFRSIVEGANWVKDQYLDQGAITPYFFRYAGLQNKVYMTDAQAPLKEASILKRAYTDPNAKAHFIVPVYGDMPASTTTE